MNKSAGKRELQLGNVTVTSGPESLGRMAILLWGPAAVGKTTFAATAPGDKLWLSFGDNEHQSVVRRKDVHVAHLAELSLDELFTQAQSDNPFGLDAVLAKYEDIGTVVVDSVTALTFRALQMAIKKGLGKSREFTPTIEAPGISAYGGRNAIVLETLTGLLRVTSKHNVHIVMTAHEADPTVKKEGGREIIDYISVMLGGQIVNNVSWRLSEIWYMSQADTAAAERRIAIKPTRLRRPMKTRMFVDSKEREFVLRYDANKPDKGQMTIASWWDTWSSLGGERLAIPK